MDKKINVISSEKQLKEWFIGNYKKIGYNKIERGDIGVFPDFVMVRNKKKIRVELETLSSHFILHKHKRSEVDEVVCIKKDIEIGIPTIEIEHLKYKSRLIRLSATIEKETNELIRKLVETGIYRNKSHVIETAIRRLNNEKKE
jgi:hypothetical protein